MFYEKKIMNIKEFKAALNSDATHIVNVLEDLINNLDFDNLQDKHVELHDATKDWLTLDIYDVDLESTITTTTTTMLENYLELRKNELTEKKAHIKSVGLVETNTRKGKCNFYNVKVDISLL